MLLTELVKLTNLKLADELLSYVELLPYFNSIIDDINSAMNTNFPDFPAPPLSTDEYAHIPDRYLRSVVVTGAAYKYYVVDEEGMGTASQYAADYSNALFLMQRDYLDLVPEEYQADIRQGSVRMAKDDAYGDRGIIVNGNEFII